MERPVPVIVQYEGLVVQVFPSMRQTCLAYGLSCDRLMRLIDKGEELDGVTFDFAQDADIEQAEAKYRRRKANEAERKKQWRLEHAAQKKM